MTGPLGPMDDDGVVGLLRAAGHGGGEPGPTDVARAMTAGKTIRRRRRNLQVAGSGLGVAVVLALGFTAVSGLDGGDGRSTVTAAGDPSTAPRPGDKGTRTAPLSSTEQQIANLQLLAAELGPDFRVNPQGRLAGDFTTGEKLSTYPVVEVIPGSPTALRLPAGYRMTGSGGVPVTGRSLEVSCKPKVEKGTNTSACERVSTTDGRTVQVQEFRVEFGKFLDSAGGRRDAAGTSAYFQRVDGSIVEGRLSIVSHGEATTTTHERAKALVVDFRDALVSFAADPRVGPPPGAASGDAAPGNPGQPTTHERNQAYLQEALGSPTFGLYDGAVSLEPNKGRYKDLPSPYFSGTATLQSLTRAQFDSACTEKADFAGCESKNSRDGLKVYTITWADRDAATDELRGESAAYYIRPDGVIVVARISLTSTRVTEKNRAEQVDGTLAWFEQLEDALIKAATDPRMKFEPSADPMPMKCSDLTAPARDTEVDHVANPETGIVELYFSVDGKNQHYVIDYLNDPTCDADPGWKRIVEDERSTSNR